MSKRNHKLIIIGKVVKFWYADGAVIFRVQLNSVYNTLDIEYNGYVSPEKVDSLFKPAVKQTLVFDCILSTWDHKVGKVYFRSFRPLLKD